MKRTVLLVILVSLFSPAMALAGPRGCTVVTASQRDSVYFGCNNDYIIRDFTYWISPSSANSYGVVFFGDRHNVQQGFNEKGLAYDANGLPRRDVADHPGTVPVNGGYTNYCVTILRECATVEEVIQWANTHQWNEFMHDQMHFADASGDAVVISVDADSRIAFTRKPQGDSFFVSTNFNLADPTNGSFPCWRYDLARSQLSELLEADDLSLESMSQVMEAVHVEKPAGWTVATLVAELTSGVIHVFYMFQYDDPIILSVADELARGAREVSLSTLFPEQTRIAANDAYESMMARQERWEIAGIVWPGLVAASIVFLFATRRRRALTFRSLFTAAVLGPVGLLPAMAGRAAIRDAFVSLAVSMVAVVSIVQLLIMSPLGTKSAGVQLVIVLLTPHVFSLLAVYGPLHALENGVSYFHSVFRLVAGVVSSTNVSLALLLPVVFPSAVFFAGAQGITVRATLALWAVSAILAIPCGLLLTLYFRLLYAHGPTSLLRVARRSALPSDMAPRAFRTSRWYCWVWLIGSVLLLLVGIYLTTRTLP